MSAAARRQRDSLWTLTVAPTIWACHFLVSYVAAAVTCAKLADPAAELTTVRVVILAATVAALLAIVVSGWAAWRRWAPGEGLQGPHDESTPGDRRRFLGYATLLLSGLSFVATVFVALPAAFIETCR